MKRMDEPLFDKFRPETKAADSAALARRIRSLVEGQPFCVLCTQGECQPYGSLIAYAFTADLKHFFFTTPTATRKFRLLSECQRTALLIDSRCQHPEDMTRVEAVTVTGRAEQLQSGDAFEQGQGLLKKRHPYLDAFLRADSTALFRIDTVRFFHVTRFQEVYQWIP